MNFRFLLISKWVLCGVLLLICGQWVMGQKLQRVTHFGNNPGNLRMYLYTPPSLDTAVAAPLVVVMHGCLQNAKKVSRQTGWNKLADAYGFRVLYPQQKILNNPTKCFCWFNRNDIEKGKGETYSTEQMVEYVKQRHAVDSSRVFITGLSAGAAMSVSLMATYPYTFQAGAIFAGGPYKVATNIWTAMMAMYGWRIKKPEAWGNLVRQQNPTYHGPYPRLIVYHGKIDVVVNRRNATELVKQWTNLQGIPPTPTEIIPHYMGHRSIEKDSYRTADSTEVVTYYRIRGMGHALPVDPGKCATQGGRRGIFSMDKNYFSTYWTAVDFGLIPADRIAGPDNVQPQATNLSFSVPAKDGATFMWKLAKGAVITAGQGTNSITVNWGRHTGNVDVIAKEGKKCKRSYPTLRVIVQQ